MLKRFTRDLFAVALRESIPKGDLEITQGNFAAVPVQDRHQPAKREREAITTLTRQQRHEFGGHEQARPLQPVSDFFPTRTHSRIVTPFTPPANRGSPNASFGCLCVRSISASLG